jgi:large subunit ribosomal protein L25
MEARLEVVRRDSFGKNAARRLRRAGHVPAVLYGAHEPGKAPEATPIAIDPKALLKILHSESGANTLIGLRFDGTDSRVMIKEYQLDPVTHDVLHVDLFRVNLDRPIEVTVPIVLKGEARGVKQQGGLIDFVHRDIVIECLPADIPEHIELDVSELMLGQGIRLKDVMETVRWKPITDPEVLLVHVVAPRAAEPEPAAAEVVATATPAEPEVIKKGKTEKAEGEQE